MAFAAADFATAFPEFSDPVAYPPGQVAFWTAQAYAQLNATRLGASLDLAAMLFVAHNLALSARSAQVVAAGGAAGQTVSPVASKSVGGVSVSYDTSNAAIQGAGEWNATSYGQRLYKMFKAFSAGPTYVPGPRAFQNAAVGWRGYPGGGW